MIIQCVEAMCYYYIILLISRLILIINELLMHVGGVKVDEVCSVQYSRIRRVRSCVIG